MSVNVVMEEEPRVFEIRVGDKLVGRVTAYVDFDGGDDESYQAEKRDENGNYVDKGWYKNLKAAGKAIVAHPYGATKVDIIRRRKA